MDGTVPVNLINVDAEMDYGIANNLLEKYSELNSIFRI